MMKTVILEKDGHRMVNLNRRKAIRYRCLDCFCWSYVGVRRCTFTKCPLHPFRSGRGKQDALVRSNAIRAYCLQCANSQTHEVGKCPAKNCPLYIFRSRKIKRRYYDYRLKVLIQHEKRLHRRRFFELMDRPKEGSSLNTDSYKGL